MNRINSLICSLFLVALLGCEYVPSADRVSSQASAQPEQSELETTSADQLSAGPEEGLARWEEQFARWKEQRDASLRSEQGWLTLIGLEWLEEGSNRIGSHPNSEVRIRSENVPAWVGVIVVDEMPRLQGDELIHANVRFVPKPGETVLQDGQLVEDPIRMRTDRQENTTVLTTGTVHFHLIERGDRLAVRIKDSEADTLTEFEGIETYPYDPKYRVEGRFEPHEELLEIADVTGFAQRIPSPGTFHFDLDGEEQSLLLLDGGPDEYFVIFSDETSGLETYGAGRYLYMDRAGEDQRAVIDFNKAYNPPCVFTDYATCPLPPRQNRLPVEIRAGEKMYSAGHEYSIEQEQS